MKSSLASLAIGLGIRAAALVVALSAAGRPFFYRLFFRSVGEA